MVTHLAKQGDFDLNLYPKKKRFDLSIDDLVPSPFARKPTDPTNLDILGCICNQDVPVMVISGYNVIAV